MPLRTRSGKDYDTRGEDKWYEPHRVTKPTKDNEDRAAMALFVVDEIPLSVSQGSADIVERHAEHQGTEDQTGHRRQYSGYWPPDRLASGYLRYHTELRLPSFDTGRRSYHSRRNRRRLAFAFHR
jgi:hypothetical protein